MIVNATASGSGADVGSGTAGQVPYYASSGTALTPTSAIEISADGVDITSTGISDPALRLHSVSGQRTSLASFFDSSGNLTIEITQVEVDSNNTFFGIGAGASITPGIYDSPTYGLISQGTNNTLYGAGAGLSLTTGSENTIVGANAGASLTGGGDPNFVAALNVFVGSNAGQDTTTGGANVFVGQKAGQGNTTGERNVYIGKGVGALNTSGSDNLFLEGGKEATGSSSIILGSTAGQYQTGSFNFAMGVGSGMYVESNDIVSIGRDANNILTTGVDMISIGLQSGAAQTTQYGNVLIGSYCGQNLVSSESTFVGSNAGRNNLDGSANTFIGYYAGYANTYGSKNTFVGDFAGYTNTTGSNQFVGGGQFAAADNVYFGKGIQDSSPTAYTLRGTAATTGNTNGADINVSGGTPAGSGEYGNVVLASNGGKVAIHASGPTIDSGTGSPEGVKTAGIGSIFMRSDGGANTSLYVKESGTGNTGWAAK